MEGTDLRPAEETGRGKIGLVSPDKLTNQLV